jgi:hypothetical protein
VPVANSPTVEVTGTKAEQEFVWACFEWLQLGAHQEEAVAALREINQFGEPIDTCLLDKKKYLQSVVRSYERMTKKKGKVSEGDSFFVVLLWSQCTNIIHTSSYWSTGP